jgi:hypothetical protein
MNILFLTSIKHNISANIGNSLSYIVCRITLEVYIMSVFSILFLQFQNTFLFKWQEKLFYLLNSDLHFYVCFV